MQNPYTLTFGKEPVEYIKRIAEERQILEDFLSPNPPQQVYMISGAYVKIGLNQEKPYKTRV